MLFFVGPHPYRQRVPSNRNRTCLVIVTGLACLCLIASAGCQGKPAPVPGVTYIATAIIQGNDGKLKPQEDSVVHVKSAVVDAQQEVAHDGSKFLVNVRKTSYGSASFEIAFPDNSVQRIKMHAGETKDILPPGKKLGVRIEVQESH